MKISVVTVCFNSAGTIADTLSSVAEQTHEDLEHLVIDGGSMDDTLEIVQAHARPGTRVLSEPDKGIYDAMNKGIAAASGQLVGFLNADDLFASPASVSLLAQAASRSDAQAVYGDLVYVRERDTSATVRRWRSGEFKPARLPFGWMPPHPTFYARRQLLQSIGGFDIGLRIAADYDLMLRLLKTPGLRVAYVPEVLVRMRMGGASNRDLQGILRKSREDLVALRRTGVGGWGTLLMKNLRKLPQFFRSDASPSCDRQGSAR